MDDKNFTQGIHHVGFTVPNILKTRDFFVESLGFKQVGERPEYPAVFVSDGTTMLTLWQASIPENARHFDRKQNIGLHHVALKVTNQEMLNTLYERFTKHQDVVIEFAPEPLGTSGLKHMMCFIPGASEWS